MIAALFSDVNWLAVLVSTLVYFVLGAIWYNFFANPWMVAIGKTREQLQAKSSKMIFLYTFILQFITCTGLAWMVRISGSDSFISGIELGLIAGLCFSAIGIIVSYMYAYRSRNLTLIDAGYNVVGIILSSVILSVWQ